MIYLQSRVELHTFGKYKKYATCVDGHAARLGTVVTVLVAWTEFRYEVGSPSLGTKSVGTLGTILVLIRP